MRALNALRLLSCHLHRIGRDRSAIAVVEFAAALPFLLVTFVSATELTNFAIIRMRVGQVALQVADNASRMGTLNSSGISQVTETDVNDVLTGAGMQAQNLNLYSRGRIIVSSLEAEANPNTNNKFWVRWQRCRGTKNVGALTPAPYSPATLPATNLSGLGPTGQVVTTPDDTGVMFVEVFYDYQPLFSAGLVPRTTIHEFASMVVRDKRDYVGPTSGAGANGGIYNTASDTVHACNVYTTT